jgi:hypothetical protein
MCVGWWWTYRRLVVFVTRQLRGKHSKDNEAVTHAVPPGTHDDYGSGTPTTDDKTNAI